MNSIRLQEADFLRAWSQRGRWVTFLPGTLLAKKDLRVRTGPTCQRLWRLKGTRMKRNKVPDISETPPNNECLNVVTEMYHPFDLINWTFLDKLRLRMRATPELQQACAADGSLPEQIMPRTCSMATGTGLSM